MVLFRDRRRKNGFTQKLIRPEFGTVESERYQDKWKFKPQASRSFLNPLGPRDTAKYL